MYVCMFDADDFIAKPWLSHDDLISMNGLGRVCDGIRPVESGCRAKAGALSIVIKAHHGSVQADCCSCQKADTSEQKTDLILSLHIHLYEHIHLLELPYQPFFPPRPPRSFQLPVSALATNVYMKQHVCYTAKS
jgi:hypothetical protein